MSDVILLRTMARKSKFDGGRHEGLSVQDLLNTERYIQLAFTYYNYTRISYQDDILEELNITKELRIEKPGKDMEMFKEWKKLFYKKRNEGKTDIEKMAQYQRDWSGRKRRNTARVISRTMSKSNIKNKHRKLST